MKILVSGATGFIGSALVPHLEASDHEIVRLVRRQPVAESSEVRWDPQAGQIDSNALQGIEGVVHLAGENLAGRRWTTAQKQAVRESRVGGTRLLSETLSRLEPRPKVLVSASAMGYYGDRGDEVLRENSGPGDDFLAEVGREWEAATSPAADVGIRVAMLRSGMVLGADGGSLARMLPPFRLGVGGPLAGGGHYVSWIALEDEVRAIAHILDNDSIDGPVNMCAPGSVTNREFTKALGRVLSRPTVFPVPLFGLRLLYGEVANYLVASLRMEPAKLTDSGFEFRFPEVEGALRAVLGKP